MFIKFKQMDRNNIFSMYIGTNTFLIAEHNKEENVNPFCFVNEKGDIFYGVMGYSFPVTFVIFLLNQLVKRAISISLPFVLLLFLIRAILVFIYLLYRRNHYGDRIIDTFEQTKFNKWYYILPICFGLQLAVLAFIAILYFYFGLI